MDRMPKALARNRSEKTLDRVLDVMSPDLIPIFSRNPLRGCGWRWARPLTLRFRAACWDRDRSRSELSLNVAALSLKKSPSRSIFPAQTSTLVTGAPSTVGGC